MFPLHALRLVGLLTLAGVLLAGEPRGSPDSETEIVGSPHPTRANRFVVTVDGISIEYSPGHEKHLRPLARKANERIARFERNRTALADAARAAAPLSAQNMDDHREDILARIAHAIGLEEPSDLQRRCYDAMLTYYQTIAELQQGLDLMMMQLEAHRRFAIWNKDDLAGRLQRGEIIEGFTWNEANQTVAFELSAFANHKPTPDQLARIQAAQRQRLDHSFNYSTDAQGVSHITATFRLDLGPSSETPTERLPSALRSTSERPQFPLPAFDFDLPLVLTPETADQPIESLMNETDRENRPPLPEFRDGQLAFVVIHETAEVGIVERYLGSADRRWFGDGAANYVAWKIACDLAGEAFARQTYDLDGQLAQYASLQKRIDLRKWPAVEHQSPDDAASELSRAHYAFATRAVAEMARTQGHDFLSHLFRELGKTPREKADMETVAAAYQKLTHQSLPRVIESAERAPLPASAPAQRP